MTEYALVGPQGEIKTYSRAVKPDVGTKEGWRWLPVERPVAVFDGETELLDEELAAVVDGTVVVTRSARAKTDEELEHDRQARLDEALPLSLATILAGLDNRLRAIEQKTPQSVEEFRESVVGKSR